MNKKQPTRRNEKPLRKSSWPKRQRSRRRLRKSDWPTRQRSRHRLRKSDWLKRQRPRHRLRKRLLKRLNRKRKLPALKQRYLLAGEFELVSV